VKEAGGEVVSYSKWFKTLVVQVNDSSKIEGIRSLPFVDSVMYVWRGNNQSYRKGLRPRLNKADCGEAKPSDTVFGLTEQQFRIHNADKMAHAGYRGKGIQVGVIDAGFTNFDVIPHFDTVKLRGYKNFVPGGGMFSASDHGTKVLSTMAVDNPGWMTGSAPEAGYWLFRSEDVTSEFPVEEDYWVRAIEFADSLGIDVINTSLGYNHFDDRLLNYSHADLTGNVSFMSLAADMAYNKGMLVVVSAGNEGNKPWQKSTPPGDAKYVLSIGAVATDSTIASFSSRGFMADGRIKPDLVSVGSGTITIGQDGSIGTTNGTSLSAPFLAGLAASLWGVNPGLHRSELVAIIKKSSDRYSAPDSVYGHGIPDFQKAMAEVLKTLEIYPKKVAENGWSIQPDISGNYMVHLINPEFATYSYSFRLLDESGKLISEHSFNENDTVLVPLSDEIRKNNRFLHFVVDDPFIQRTYRIKR
jgi:Subtilisin-like serine proteases